MLDKKCWYIKITDKNYDILSKWFKSKTNYELYKKGICGVYKKKNEYYVGHTCGEIEGDTFTFGNEITFEQFKKYVLKEENIISIDTLSTKKEEFNKILQQTEQSLNNNNLKFKIKKSYGKSKKITGNCKILKSNFSIRQEKTSGKLAILK
jgi:superoxide dismutase